MFYFSSVHFTVKEKKWPYSAVTVTSTTNCLRSIRIQNFLRLEKLIRVWPKALSSQGWYNEMPQFLFHACRTCMCRVSEITSAGNCNKTRQIINSACCFIHTLPIVDSRRKLFG